MFPHRNIPKYLWSSTVGKNHIQTNHVLTDKRWHSSILSVRCFRTADCDNDHYLMIAKVREKLSVSKQSAQSLIAKELISES